MTTSSASITDHINKGATWITIQMVASRAVQVVSQVVLGWIISPQQFGQIGLCITLIALLSPITTFGIEEVVIQRRRAIAGWLALAFWVSIICSLLAYIGLVAAVYLLQSVNENFSILSMAMISGSALPIAALSTVPNILLRSKLKFGALAMVGLAESFTTALLTIVLAYCGLGAYSVIIALPAGQLIRTIVLWNAARPTLSIAVPRQWRRIIPRSSQSAGNHLMSTIVSQGDYLSLSFFSTQAQVGLYFFAFRLAIQPIRIFAGGVGSVLFPALATQRLDRAEQENTALLAAQALSLIVMEFCFLQAAVCPLIIKMLFDPVWYNTIIIAQLLSVGLAFDAPGWAAGAYIQAKGSFDRSVKFSIASGIGFLIFVSIGSAYFDAVGAATGVVAFYCMCTPIYICYVFSDSKISKFVIVTKVFIKPFLLTASTVLIAAYVSQTLFSNPVARLVSVITISAALYLPLFATFFPTIFYGFTARLNRKFKLARI
jgi:O-antigen/teichoic acid export membrane protein